MKKLFALLAIAVLVAVPLVYAAEMGEEGSMNSSMMEEFDSAVEQSNDDGLPDAVSGSNGTSAGNTTGGVFENRPGMQDEEMPRMPRRFEDREFDEGRAKRVARELRRFRPRWMEEGLKTLPAAVNASRPANKICVIQDDFADLLDELGIEYGEVDGRLVVKSVSDYLTAVRNGAKGAGCFSALPVVPRIGSKRLMERFSGEVDASEIEEMKEKMKERLEKRLGRYEEEKRELRRLIVSRNRERLLNKTLEMASLYALRLERKISGSNISNESKQVALSYINDSLTYIADAARVLESNLTAPEKRSLVMENLRMARESIREALRVYATARIEGALEKLDTAIQRIEQLIDEMKAEGKDTTALEFALAVLREKRDDLSNRYEEMLEGNFESAIRSLKKFRIEPREIKEIGVLRAEGEGVANITMVVGTVEISGSGTVVVDGGNVRASGFEEVNGTYTGEGKISVTGKGYSVSFSGSGELSVKGVGKTFLKGSGKYKFKGVEGYWSQEGETLVFEGDSE